MILFFIALLIILLGFSALFSGSETAFFSLSPLQREQIGLKHDKTSKKLLSLIENPGRFLASVLTGNMIVNITATVLVTATMNRFFPGKGAEYAVPVMLTMLLLFGEITPKIVASRWNISFARGSAPIIDIVMKMLFPLRILIEKISAIFAPQKLREEELTEADLRMCIDLIWQSGNWSPGLVRALLGTLELDRYEISRFGIPRHNWIALSPEQKVSDAREKISDGIIVIEQNDEILGIIDRFNLIGIDNTANLMDIAQSPMSISE